MRPEEDRERQELERIVRGLRRAETVRIGSACAPDEAQRALRELGADIDLLSIVDSWQDTLSDEDILQLLKNWNAGRPLFQSIHASTPD